HVGKKQQFKTVGEAVHTANAFDTLIIHEGVYKEHSLLINKPLTIMAEGKAIIDAESTVDDLFIIVSDSVTIIGLELINVGVSFLKEIAAVKIQKSKHIKIHNNLIKNCFFGIY